MNDDVCLCGYESRRLSGFILVMLKTKKKLYRVYSTRMLAVVDIFEKL